MAGQPKDLSLDALRRLQAAHEAEEDYETGARLRRETVPLGAEVVRREREGTPAHLIPGSHAAEACGASEEGPRIRAEDPGSIRRGNLRQPASRR